MTKHKHSYLKRNEVIGGHWKLHNLFRNPKVKQVLIGCSVCYPKKKINPKKDGRIYSLEG
jgi:hypothetical protein